MVGAGDAARPRPSFAAAAEPAAAEGADPARARAPHGGPAKPRRSDSMRSIRSTRSIDRQDVLVHSTSTTASPAHQPGHGATPYGGGGGDDDGDACSEPKPPLTLRQRVEVFFEEPEVHDARFFPDASRHACFCGPARLVSNLTVVVIILSQVVLCLESTQAFYIEAQEQQEPWFGMEIGIVAWFTAEYLIRLWASSNRWGFFLGGLNICDLVAILPFYVEQALQGNELSFNFKVFRLFRVVRILKVSRFLQGIQTIIRALRQTRDQLLMGLCLLVVSMFLWSTATFYVEREWNDWDPSNQLWLSNRKVLNTTNPDRYTTYGVQYLSPFQSIPHTFWWCITTLTTVGYGDAVPVSPPGKVFAGLTMITGVFVLALPTSIIGSKFLELYKEEEMEKAREAEKHACERRDAEMTELLVLIGDLADSGRLTTSTTCVAADYSLSSQPGQAEEVQAAAFSESYYPRVRAIYEAAMMADSSEERTNRFVRNIFEFLRQKRFLEQRHQEEQAAAAARRR